MRILKSVFGHHSPIEMAIYSLIQHVFIKKCCMPDAVIIAVNKVDKFLLSWNFTASWSII